MLNGFYIPPAKLGNVPAPGGGGFLDWLDDILGDGVGGGYEGGGGYDNNGGGGYYGGTGGDTGGGDTNTNNTANPCAGIVCTNGGHTILFNGACECVLPDGSNPNPSAGCTAAVCGGQGLPLYIDGVCHCVTPVNPGDEEEQETPTVCTMEARICSNGSYVGRNPNNNCEFFPCPILPTTAPPAGVATEAIANAVAFAKTNPTVALAIGGAVIAFFILRD